jgi:hypothetical protein
MACRQIVHAQAPQRARKGGKQSRYRPSGHLFYRLSETEGGGASGSRLVSSNRHSLRRDEKGRGL